jgi:putative ABC transport system permease protein
MFTARQRIKEIGIRKVNGAKVDDVMIMLNKDYSKLA